MKPPKPKTTEPATQDKAVDLLDESTRAHIRELVAAAPPLTQEQLARIRVLLPSRRRRAGAPTTSTTYMPTSGVADAC